MKCPVDDTTLAISDRQGIEIDYCPTCRGVWLDRGELDKLIERENRWVEERVNEERAAPSKTEGGEAQEEEEILLTPAGRHGDGSAVADAHCSAARTWLRHGSGQLQ